MPPATMTSASPALIACAASITALSPEPHTLLIVTALTVAGMPDLSSACRAGACPTPPWMTLPMMTSWTSPPAMPARSSAARMATAPSSGADSDDERAEELADRRARGGDDDRDAGGVGHGGKSNAGEAERFDNVSCEYAGQRVPGSGTRHDRLLRSRGNAARSRTAERPYLVPSTLVPSTAVRSSAGRDRPDSVHSGGPHATSALREVPRRRRYYAVLGSTVPAAERQRPRRDLRSHARDELVHRRPAPASALRPPRACSPRPDPPPPRDAR